MYVSLCATSEYCSVYIDGSSKVMLPDFASAHNHVGYSFCGSKDMGFTSVA